MAHSKLISSPINGLSLVTTCNLRTSFDSIDPITDSNARDHLRSIYITIDRISSFHSKTPASKPSQEQLGARSPQDSVFGDQHRSDNHDSCKSCNGVWDLDVEAIDYHYYDSLPVLTKEYLARPTNIPYPVRNTRKRSFARKHIRLSQTRDIQIKDSPCTSQASDAATMTVAHGPRQHPVEGTSAHRSRYGGPSSPYPVKKSQDGKANHKGGSAPTQNSQPGAGTARDNIPTVENNKTTGFPCWHHVADRPGLVRNGACLRLYRFISQIPRHSWYHRAYICVWCVSNFSDNVAKRSHSCIKACQSDTCVRRVNAANVDPMNRRPTTCPEGCITAGQGQWDAVYQMLEEERFWAEMTAEQQNNRNTLAVDDLDNFMETVPMPDVAMPDMISPDPQSHAEAFVRSNDLNRVPAHDLGGEVAPTQPLHAVYPQLESLGSGVYGDIPVSTPAWAEDQGMFEGIFEYDSMLPQPPTLAGAAGGEVEIGSHHDRPPLPVGGLFQAQAQPVTGHEQLANVPRSEITTQGIIQERINLRLAVVNFRSILLGFNETPVVTALLRNVTHALDVLQNDNPSGPDLTFDDSE